MENFEIEDELNKKYITKYPIIEDLAKKVYRKALARNMFYITADDCVEEVISAINDVNERRRFTPTEKKLFENKYETIVVKLCILNIAKYGAEGETSHSENGISRSYEGPDGSADSILKKIVPLARGVDLK
mgnify:FL=1